MPTFEAHGRNPIFRYETFSACHSTLALQDLFTKTQLYLNSRDQFNDPFEMQPTFAGNIKRSEITRLIHLKSKVAGIRRAARRQLIKSKQKFILNYDSNGSFDTVLNTDLDSYGIKCFAREYDDIRMWSHYSDGHKGYCVEFLPNSQNTLSPLIRVRYSDQRPEIKREVISLTGGLSFKDSYEKVLLTKANAWSTEREVRLLVPNKPRRHTILKPEELKAVYFGCRAEQKNIDRAMELCGNARVKFFKMVMCSETYRLIPHLLPT